MTRYKLVLVFYVNEEVEMKYVLRERVDKAKADMRSLAFIAFNEISHGYDEEKHPHINRLYDDVLERIETPIKHLVTYDDLSRLINQRENK